MQPTVTDQQAQRIGRVALGDNIHRAARRFGDKIAVIDGTERTSFTLLDALSNQFAHALLAGGLRPGDKVGMLCANSTQMLLCLIGIQKAGLVWVPINTGLAPDAIGFILTHAEIKQMVLDSTFYARAEIQALAVALSLPPLLCTTLELVELPPARSVMAMLQGQPASLPDGVIESGQLAQIMYTSGTTGRQKGVMHSHASVQAALMGNIAEMSIQCGDTVSTLLPLFHCAQHAITMTYLLAGATVVMMRGFEPGAVLDAIETHRMTAVVALPMMYAALLAHPSRQARDLSCLRFCLYAMAPMSRLLLTQLIDEFCPNFALCGGQTEIYPATMIFTPDQQLRRFGSYWGVSTLVNETAIMDDHGRLLEGGQAGEVVHRGPNVMLGYYEDPVATAKAQEFGWHHTGDLGKFDEDGQLLFLDRKKDMIKTGGENVPSIKVEEVLLRHPDVANVAVVGLPHERWIEAITAFVLCKAGNACDSATLEAHCRAHLGGFEVPKRIVILDALPLTATGKLQKHLLRDQYRDLYAGAG